MFLLIVMVELGKVFRVTYYVKCAWSIVPSYRYFKNEADAMAFVNLEVAKNSGNNSANMSEVKTVLMLYFQGEYFNVGEPILLH